MSTILKAHGATYYVKNIDDGVEFGFAMKKAGEEQTAESE